MQEKNFPHQWLWNSKMSALIMEIWLSFELVLFHSQIYSTKLSMSMIREMVYLEPSYKSYFLLIYGQT